MGLKEPKIALTTILSKIKCKTAKAEKTGEWMQLCMEMSDLMGMQDIVGQMSDRARITPQWLQHGTPLSDSTCITNHIVAELYYYGRRKSITWKSVLEEWWPKLCPLRVYTPPRGTVISSWESIVERKRVQSRDSSQENKEKFLTSVYSHPSPKPDKPPAETVEEPIPFLEPTENAHSGYDTDSNSVEISPYLLRRHGDTIKILHELLETEKKEKSCLEKQLADTEANCRDAQQRAWEAEECKKATDAALKTMGKEHVQECSKYKS